MPEFESKISLVGLIQIGLIVIGFAAAWGKVPTREEVALELEKVKSESVTKEVNTLQIQMLTLQVTALDKKIETISTDVKDIKRTVRQ